MRVLLINGPGSTHFLADRYHFLPSNLLYLSSSLKANGIESKILDLNSPEKVRLASDWESKLKLVSEYLCNYKPDLVGIPCLFSSQIISTLILSDAVKNNLKVPIVIGGIHPTIYYKEIIENCNSIDYIVLGEGEITLVKLCNYLQGKQAIEEIDGIVYRNMTKMALNPKTTYTNIDEISWPDYAAIKIEDYFEDTSSWHNPKKIPINTSIPIITSRACPHRCTFCAMFMVMGSKYRARQAIDVVDEIEFLYKEYNHRHFTFYDDNMTFSKPRTLKICSEIIRRKMDIQFETPNGVFVNSLDKEVVDALVDAGLTRISLGIESGSEYIRNTIMGKKLATKKIYEVIKLCKKHKDLFVRALFVIGMPEDTTETLEDTYNMIVKLDIDQPIVTNLMPFPGTKVFEQSIKDGLLRNIDVKNLWRYGDIYQTGNKQFFVQPYNMTLEELDYFRAKFDRHIEYCRQRHIDKKNNRTTSLEYKE
jgi:radical SAM superfamily enzyme YgiQ (UPF0313 family)